MRKVAAIGLALALCGYAFGEVTVKPIPATKPAATAPANATQPPKLQDLIAKMPEELRYSRGEAVTRYKARKEWIAANVAGVEDKRAKETPKSSAVTIEGTVTSVHADTKRPVIYVGLTVAPMEQMGAFPIKITVELPEKYEKETMAWNAGDTAVFSGKLASLEVKQQDNPAGRMTDAKIVTHAARVEPPKKPSKKKSSTQPTEK